MKKIVINKLDDILSDLIFALRNFGEDFRKPELTALADGRLANCKEILDGFAKLQGICDAYTVNNALKYASEAVWSLYKAGFEDTANYFHSILLEWKQSMKEKEEVVY